MLRLPSVVIFLFGLAAGVTGLYEASGPVSLLTQRSFSKVLDSPLPVVVEFFAPWCGHCKALAPAYSRAAEKLKGIVPFVAVDCDAEKNKPLCGQYGVQGFPTIKLFRSGKAAPTDYQGERSAKALVDAASALLTAKHIKRVGGDGEAQAFLEQEGAKVLLFTDKPKASPLYKSLSTRFQPKLAFAEVGPKATETAARLGVTAHPTLVVVDADDQQHTYTGELKATNLIDYLKRFTAGAKAGPKGESKPGKEPDGQGEQAAPEASRDQEGAKKQKGKQHRAEEAASEVAALPSVVGSVTLAELQGRVLAQEGVFVLAVFAGTEESCAAKQTQLDQAVHGLHGLAKAFQLQLGNAGDVAAAAKQLTAVDENGLAAAGEGGGCPAQVFLLPFADKEDGDEWKKYSGELTTKELQKALLGAFPDSFVTLIDATTQTNFMLQDPTRVKVLLFTDKDEVPGILRALSCNFRPYKMDFGMVPSSEEKIMKQFNVPKVPHLVLAFPRPDNAEELGLGPGPLETAKHKPIAIQAYPGPMRYPHIARFLQLLAIQLNAAPQEVLEEFLGAEGGPVRVPRSAATLHQLSSQQDLEEKCLEKGGICIIAALPPQQVPAPSPETPAADSAAAEGGASAPPQLSLEMAVLQRVAVHRAAAGAGSALHFLWVDAAKYRGFAAAFGVPAPGQQPAVVALAPRKQRYAVMDGPLLLDTLERFVDGLLSGKVTTAPLQGVPELKEQEEQPVEQQQPVLEEEFDLAEIMQEEVVGDVGKREELLSKEGQKKKSAKRKGGKKKKGKKGTSKDEL